MTSVQAWIWPRMVWYANVLLVLVVSFAIKYLILRPVLEARFKRSFPHRQNRRRRQLRDLFQDHILVQHLREKLERRHPNDKQRVEEEMEQFRQLSLEQDQVSDGRDTDSKGHERKQAARIMLFLTFGLLWLSGDVFIVAEWLTRCVSVYCDFEDFGDGWGDGWGGGGIFIVVFAVHFFDSSLKLAPFMGRNRRSPHSITDAPTEAKEGGEQEKGETGRESSDGHFEEQQPLQPK